LPTLPATFYFLNDGGAFREHLVDGYAADGRPYRQPHPAACAVGRFLSPGGNGDRPRPLPTLRSPVLTRKEDAMAESIYKVIELIGTSTKSWEDAAKNAVETASKSLRDLRVAEITKLDLKIEHGKATAFRARVSLSFKYQKGD
jgi:dodecin